MKQINLITGLNNIGKTAFLESIFLFSGQFNPLLIFKLDSFRGIDTRKIELKKMDKDPFISLFNQFDTSKTIILEGNNIDNSHQSIHFKALNNTSEIDEASKYIKHGVENSKVYSIVYNKGDNKSTKHYVVMDTEGLLTRPVPPSPRFQIFFQGSRMHTSNIEDAECYGKLEVQDKQNDVLDILQLIEPRLKRLAVIVVANEPILHGDIGIDRLIPLAIMGGGMVRLASLITRIANAQDGILLIDEIENGLHHSVMDKLWHAIGKVAKKFNTQIFATTHSYECIVAAYKAFSEETMDNFCLHRIERTNGSFYDKVYDQETFKAAIQSDLEMR